MKPMFKNKVVVITGGASGIGKALGYQFAKNGARVGLLDQDAGRSEACARGLCQSGMEAIGLRCDVTREAECRKAMDTVVDTYGGIDVLVNNAGITLRETFIRTRIMAYRKVMEVNFFGALNCTRASIDSLVRRKGMIIVISSIAGLSPLPGRSGYCASKYALHGLFDTLRIELESAGVDILIVCPSFVKTNLQTRALGGDGKVTTRPQSLMGKPETPERTAETIYRAAVRRKKQLIPTSMGQLAYWINRLLPQVYSRIIARQFKSELIC